METTPVQSFDLETFLTDTLIRYKKDSIRKGIELSLIDDRASGLTIQGDSNRLRHLIELVLDNTVQRSGATRISFSTRQLLKTGTEVLLEFLLEENGPTGKGVRPFAYFRALAKARLLIEGLHGKSEIGITPGSGTTLRFVIKCAWSEAAEKTAHTESACTASLKTRRVLIAEDNDINQLAITRLLQREGIEYTLASNGKEAVDLLEREEFDLVLLDLHMPYMDGLQATTYIRKFLRQDTPIIGMVAGDDGLNLVQCLEAGMNQFIRKPFTGEELLTQMCSFFDPMILVQTSRPRVA